MFSLGACYVMECPKKSPQKTLEIFLGKFLWDKKNTVGFGYTTWFDFNFKGPKPRQVIGRAKTPWEHGTGLGVRAKSSFTRYGSLSVQNDPIDTDGNIGNPTDLMKLIEVVSGTAFLQCHLGGWQPVPSSLNRSTRCLSSWNSLMLVESWSQQIKTKGFSQTYWTPLKQFHHDLSPANTPTM